VNLRKRNISEQVHSTEQAELITELQVAKAGRLMKAREPCG
jgi:hypothetical protein